MDARPEHQLILLCARARLTPADQERIRALACGDVDWDELLQAACAHGVAPLLFRHLGACCGESVPPEAAQRLHLEAARSAAKSRYLSGELEEILRALRAAGISAIAFKGPTLALQAYGDLSLRSFGDLDILVPVGQVALARETVLSRGYSSKYPARRGLSPAQFRGFLRAEYNDEFTRSSDGAKVELHWHFAPRFFGFVLDAQQLWSRADHVVLHGERVATLGREDLVLVLCVHGAEHAWVSLEGIAAVAELMRGAQGLDWAVLLHRAQQAGALRMVQLGALLAADVLGVDLPAAVARAARADRQVTLLAQAVRRNLFRDDLDPRLEAHRLKLFLFYLRAKDSWLERIRFCVRMLTTPTERDWQVARLPDRLFPLYRLIRAFRLLTRVGGYGRWVLGRK